MNNPVLSICVVTMNRAEQLRNALLSCLACDLPKETEFVIVDNASTDNTGDIVRSVLENSGYCCYYEVMHTNLGCGGGRNYAFQKARGQYIYVLDDDAFISDKCPDFFIKALSYFTADDRIVTLTTQIYDMAWGKTRLQENGPQYQHGLHLCKMFCGGSHFVRKSFFLEAPYLSNKYGYEELKPSLYVSDAGKINAFAPELLIIHNPMINKWKHTDEMNYELLINECAVLYAVKKMMFPLVFYPIIRLAYVSRCKKHLSHIPNGKRRADAIVSETITQFPIKKKIRIITVIWMCKRFGLSVF